MIRASKPRDPEARVEFATSEGLRRVLVEIAEYGPAAWRELPVAGKLAEYVIERYRPLSRSWGRDPADAGYAAFLALRGENLLYADDPWAVVTTAVQRSISAEEHADRLLTSADTASRPGRRPAMRPVRAGTDQEFLYDLAAPAPTSTDGSTLDALVGSAAFVLGALGWPEELAAAVVEYVADRAADAASRSTAHDLLRRDVAGRANFGLDQPVWAATLRLLLGDHREPGLLARLLARQPADDIALVPGFVQLAAEVMW